MKAKKRRERLSRRISDYCKMIAEFQMRGRPIAGFRCPGSLNK